MAMLSLIPPSWYDNHLEAGVQRDTKRYMWKLRNCMKCNELCKLCIMRCCLSVPVVSANTQLWRIMALMDLCLHDGVKLQHPTYDENVRSLQSIKIFLHSRVCDLKQVMVWFQQLDGLG